jgi:phage terminase small subunit
VASRGKVRKLTAKQARFVVEIAVDGNATRAYKASGFTAKNDGVAATSASRLLRNAQVAAAIAAQQEKIADKLEINAEWVAKQLVRNHERAHESDKPDLHASNRAIELLGKHCGMFVDKSELEVKFSLASLVAKAVAPKDEP